MGRGRDSVFDEPHMRRGGPCWRCGYDRTGIEERDACPECGAGAFETDKDDAARIDQSVWDEAGLTPDAAPERAPDDGRFASWVADKRAKTPWLMSWAVTWGVAVLAGPWAVLGSLLSVSFEEGAAWSSVIAAVLIGPAVEEIMKVSLLAYVVERRPYLLKSGVQVLLCAAAGGVAFAAIENVMYLRVYVDTPSQALIAWRWTVCVALHAGCSLVAGAGLLRVWARIWPKGDRPELLAAYPLTLAAIAVHGAYNAVAMGLEVSGQTL